MANRDSVHQSGLAKSSLGLGAQYSKLPLLPFEKQLIELLGCSEKEYRYFAEQARWRGLQRPAEYDHIPDIQATGLEPWLVTTLISLAVGVVTSAISYLLMPKPKEGRGTTQRSLGDLTGSSRFADTFGFESQAELADYGAPIPIVFGRYTGTSGGIVFSPKMVWSRMFSYGTQQGVKLMFVVGEQGRDAGQTPQGIDPPSISGIFLGNGPLDAIYANSFAFYWKRDTTISGFSRIKSVNLLYGTRALPQSGDPETSDDIFSCPTIESANDTGFCSAHALSNNAEFGCYTPIANGTAYRVNWRVVSIPYADKVQPIDNLYYERVKISGDKNGTIATTAQIHAAAMPGVGRNYNRRMGITALNGSTVSNQIGTEERFVNINDTIQFTISAQQIPDNFYSNDFATVTVSDINSELNEQRIAADDALRIGELFMIARTTWQVVSRKLPQWRPEDNQDQIIDLKCIDINAPSLNKIGLVSSRMLTEHVLSDDNGQSNGLHAGPAYYPLMRFAKGTVRNSRACEVTEIGLRSKVYQRLNGLCNFQAVPTPDELHRADQTRLALSGGSATVFIRRASVFTIFLRPAGLDPNGLAYDWVPLGMRFAVVGNQPTEVYNYIRLQHPQKKQYEFQFIPKNGADMRNSPDSATFFVINAGASVANSGEQSLLSADFETNYGRFTVTTVGKIALKPELRRNPEFATKAIETSASSIRSYPSAVGINSYLPDEEDANTRVASVSYVDLYSNPGGFTQGRTAAFGQELFGNADASPVGVNNSATVTARELLPNSQWIELQYRATKLPLPSGHFSGQQFLWAVDGNATTVINSSGGFDSGQEFVVSRNIGGGNPFRNVPGEGTISQSGLLLRAAGVISTSQPQGRSQGAFEEIFGPARNNDFGFKKTVTLTIVSPKLIELQLESEVYYEPNHWAGVNKLWTKPKITASRNANTATTWAAGELFSKVYSVGVDNPFAQDYLRRNISIGVQFIIQGVSQTQVTADAFTADRIFEDQSQYADLSFYGNLVEKSNDSSPEHQIVYVNESVSNKSTPNYDKMTVCGLALKAGRNFTNLDQIRLWLANGGPVTRFHPDDAGAPVGPSNLFSDLVFYLLTNRTAGLGQPLSMTAEYAPLVNTADFVKTAKFLKTNRLFFDGVLGDPVNFRQFVSDTAPSFLCNFVISDGKFSVVPALPTTASGEISTQPVVISQLFTAGNILEGSFELEYLSSEERRDFQAVVRYRETLENQLPQERNTIVRWADAAEFLPVESFDLTGYCTSLHHAQMVGKFYLALRRRISHSVRFRTAPYGLNLAPGDYIKVVTEASPYDAARNGVVDASGNVTSATQLSDGQYDVLYYKGGSDDVKTGTLAISGGIVRDATFYSIIFTLIESNISQNIYMVEQLTLDEDGTVQIAASEFPCNENLASIVAADVLSDSPYIFEN
jgi:hypothetical protein